MALSLLSETEKMSFYIRREASKVRLSLSLPKIFNFFNWVIVALHIGVLILRYFFFSLNSYGRDFVQR